MVYGLDDKEIPSFDRSTIDLEDSICEDARESGRKDSAPEVESDSETEFVAVVEQGEIKASSREETGFEEPAAFVNDLSQATIARVYSPISNLTTSIPPKLVHPVWIMDRPPHASIIDGRVIRPEKRFVSRSSGTAVSPLHWDSDFSTVPMYVLNRYVGPVPAAIYAAGNGIHHILDLIENCLNVTSTKAEDRPTRGKAVNDVAIASALSVAKHHRTGSWSNPNNKHKREVLDTVDDFLARVPEHIELSNVLRRLVLQIRLSQMSFASCHVDTGL
ncbi:hypothetical protein VTN00DRAFT_8264 [Thermoascus crustaceus]|uniref:uncharacterized protein n=1 Tax=Thermoascus crustaceus TaxID=5088 RepID=UPI0037435DBE